MKTKNNRKIHAILYSLLLLALLVPMLACGDSDNKQTVNRPVPNDTLTEEKPKKEEPTPATNPAEAFAGVWETKDPRATSPSAGTTQFVRWKISSAIEKDGQYVGKITDVSDNNKDVANYVLGPKNSITLEYLQVIRELMITKFPMKVIQLH